MKYVFIVCGKARSGKATFFEIMQELGYGVERGDLIAPVRNMLKTVSLYSEDKSPALRKLMSDIKDCLDAYNDYTISYGKNIIDSFKYKPMFHWENILFINSRSEKDINSLRDYVLKEQTDMKVKTILIRSNRTKGVIYGNDADDNQDNIVVDTILDNSGTIDDFVSMIKDFLKSEVCISDYVIIDNISILLKILADTFYNQNFDNVEDSGLLNDSLYLKCILVAAERIHRICKNISIEYKDLYDNALRLNSHMYGILSSEHFKDFYSKEVGLKVEEVLSSIENFTTPKYIAQTYLSRQSFKHTLYQLNREIIRLADELYNLYRP